MALDFDLSSITFPGCVTGIKLYDGEWFKGGYNYSTNHDGWTSYNVIRDYKSILLADYYITPTENNVLETSWIPIIKFPNGYEYRIMFHAWLNGQNYNYGFRGNLFDLDGNGVGNEAISGTSCYVGMTTGLSTPLGTLYQDLLCEFFLYTRYYPTVNPSSSNHPNQLVLGMVFGSLTNGFASKEGIVYLNEWSGQETYSYEPLRFLQISNLDNYNSYIKSHGNPVTGDIFTDEPIPDDPAGSDDTSQAGGGEGNYDDTSDPIDFPSLPTGGALECGAIVAHRVSAQTMLAIIAKLWDTSIWDPAQSWQKSIDDPMNAIVSLHCLPVSPSVGQGLDPIWIGNFETELSSPKVTSQYVEVDCGSIDVKEYWGSALDYSPYTRVEIYLPFVGIKDLSAEDVMRSTIHVKYHVDVLSGDVIAFVKCGLSVLYHFRGNCCMAVPLTSRSKDTLINALTGVGQVVSGTGSGMAVGGAAGGLGIAGTALSVAANVVASKVRTSKGSELGGAGSLMDDFIPYLIFHRPVQSLAKNYNKFKGYPSNITAVLGNLSGYTEVEHIHLTGIPNATSEEMDEIVNLLKEGIII